MRASRTRPEIRVGVLHGTLLAVLGAHHARPCLRYAAVLSTGEGMWRVVHVQFSVVGPWSIMFAEDANDSSTSFHLGGTVDEKVCASPAFGRGWTRQRLSLIASSLLLSHVFSPSPDEKMLRLARSCLRLPFSSVSPHIPVHRHLAHAPRFLTAHEHVVRLGWLSPGVLPRRAKNMHKAHTEYAYVVRWSANRGAILRHSLADLCKIGLLLDRHHTCRVRRPLAGRSRQRAL